MSESMTVRLSAGTAAVAGLIPLRQTAQPTTAYMLVGGNCQGQCAFCPQGSATKEESNFLSRISWPQYDLAEALAALKLSIMGGDFSRICLQVTQSEASDHLCETLLQELANPSVPISMSRSPEHCGSLKKWFDLGVDRLGLPIDAATAEIYEKVKGGCWDTARANLHQAARFFPGQVSTHLIIGLGESEEEAVGFLQAMAQIGVTVGLFAFTPSKGTPLANHPPPEAAIYRRVQVARWLLSQFPHWEFGFVNGKVLDFGMSKAELLEELSKGQAFETSGCPLCNRPYYNERPRGVMYNYPRRLSADEVSACLQQLNE